MALNVASLFVGVTANTQQAEGQLNAFAGTIKSVANRMEATGAGITTLAAPIAATGIAVAKLGSDFEHSLNRVRKTTGLTTEETAALGKGILDLSASPAGGAQSADALARIAEVAGQLGIEGVANILQFTKVIAQFSNATGIAGDQAAASLNAITLLTGLRPDQLENVSSTIVDLGNRTAATESQISEFALRLSGALHTAGASAQEILGISATLASLQIDPEAGGTAISKFFIDMSKAASDAGGGLKDTSVKSRELQEHLQDLSTSLNAALQAQTQFGRNTPAATVNANATAIDRYKREIADAQADITKLNGAQTNAAGSAAAMAKVAGLTTDEFRQLVKTDPTAAFTKIVQGIKNISETQGGGAAFEAVASLGVDDARQIRAMLGLAEGASQLQTNIDIANGAFADNTAAARENAAAMDDTQNKFELLTNQIKRQIIDAWDLLRPSVLAAMDAVRTNVLPALESARLAFGSLSPSTQGFIIAIGAILVVLGPVLVLLGLMATAISAISLPVLAVIAVVGLLAAAWITNFGGIRDKTAEVLNFIKDNWQTLLQILLPGVGTLALVFIQNFDTIKAVVGRFISFWGTVFVLALSIGERVLREIGGFFDTFLRGPIEMVGVWIGEHILSPLLEMLKFIQNVLTATGIGGFDIGGAIRGGELALQGLSQGIAGGGPGQANNVIVTINNPVIADNTAAEALATQVRSQLIDIMVNSERASSPPPEPGLPGRPF